MPDARLGRRGRALLVIAGLLAFIGAGLAVLWRQPMDVTVEVVVPEGVEAKGLVLQVTQPGGFTWARRFAFADGRATSVQAPLRLRRGRYRFFVDYDPPGAGPGSHQPMDAELNVVLRGPVVLMLEDPSRRSPPAERP